jgi:hypothetical protein
MTRIEDLSTVHSIEQQRRALVKHARDNPEHDPLSFKESIAAQVLQPFLHFPTQQLF